VYDIGPEPVEDLRQAVLGAPDRDATVERQPKRTDSDHRHAVMDVRAGSGGDDQGLVAGTTQVPGGLLNGVAHAVDRWMERLCHQGDPHACDDGG